MTKSAIVVAAGSSTRMGSGVRKPFLTLRRKPILAWTLAALAKVDGLKQIVLVTRPDDRDTAAAAVRTAKLPRSIGLTFANGGARRQDSVHNGLKAASSTSELILIHDAARPFPPQDAVARACVAASEMGAAILACRVKDTVKRELENAPVQTAPLIGSTVARAGLWLAQTPQVFRREMILDLFERLARETSPREVTDDASVCELYGQPVALIESSEMNIKITRPEDLKIAEAFLKAK